MPLPASRQAAKRIKCPASGLRLSIYRLFLRCRLPDQVVSERLVTAVAVRLVVTVFALAQVVILAFIAGKSLRSELAALVGTIAEGLLATLATGAEKIFAVFFQGDFAGAVGCDGGLCHFDLRWQRFRRLHHGCKVWLLKNQRQRYHNRPPVKCSSEFCFLS